MKIGGGEREQAHRALIDHHAKTINDLCKTVEIHKGYLDMHSRILLRARHIEVHVEHLSLGRAPILDAEIPELLWDDHWYFKNRQWGATEEEAKKVWELSEMHYEDALRSEDYRIPSVHAFISGRPIPHPTKVGRKYYYNRDWLTRIPEHPRFRSRSRSPPPSRGKEPVTDEIPEFSYESDEYWIESAQNNPDDIIGPSSAHE